MRDKEYYISEIKRRVPDIDAESAIEAIGVPDKAKVYGLMLEQMAFSIPAHLEAMAKAAEARELSTFAVTVHGIKGTLRQIGYVKLSKDAELLERSAKADNLSFCINNFPTFRDDLICFLEQLKEILGTNTQDYSVIYEISEYKDILAKAKAAVLDYEMLLAAELLSPLQGKSFGNGADLFVDKILKCVSSFQVEASLDAFESFYKERLI